MKFTGLLFITVALLTTIPAMGQQAVPLTFGEALEKTLTGNPSLQAAQYEELSAEQERKAAFGLRLPQIGVTGAYVHMGDDIAVDLNNLKDPVKGLLGSIGQTGLPIPPAILEQANALLGKNWGMNIQDRDLGFVGGTVTMPIYMGGKINAANRAARINEQTVQVKGTNTRNSLVSELVERYYGLSLAMQAVKVREQVNEAMKVHLSDARALEESGMIARSERLYVEVKAAEAERDLLAARLQVQTIGDALSNTVSEQQEFDPVSPMFVLDVLPEVDYFKETALQYNPQLKQVGLTKNLAQEGVKAKRAEFLPQVAALGGMSFYNYQVSKYVPKWFVGAGIKINIFDGLNKEYKYNAARYTVKQVEAAEAKAQRDITTLIEKLYNEMENYNERIRAIEKSMDFAVEYLRVQNVGFREGAVSATDVIDAELNLAATRIEKLQTAYYYDLMLARLLEAAGISGEFARYAEVSNARYIVYE